jgi:hypothetical protein
MIRDAQHCFSLGSQAFPITWEGLPCLVLPVGAVPPSLPSWPTWDMPSMSSCISSVWFTCSSARPTRNTISSPCKGSAGL